MTFSIAIPQTLIHTRGQQQLGVSKCFSSLLISHIKVQNQHEKDRGMDAPRCKLVEAHIIKKMQLNNISAVFYAYYQACI